MHLLCRGWIGASAANKVSKGFPCRNSGYGISEKNA
jgi:hypothetical protein